ncbi:acylneuraminate cytidylyltransferase family protein [Achromobacter animicus]|jgi:CMP-N-acetylneuraminic acid synthetase
MTDHKKAIAIIPARGGSKRLPRKNVLPLCGKPLIAWTIEAAKDCGLFDLILVTSDDQEVLDIAANLGVAPLLRPLELASDTASTLDVVLHVLDHLHERGQDFDSVALLQATSPMRDAHDIEGAYAKYEQANANCVISVSPVEHPVEWTMELGADANLDQFTEKMRHARSQDLPQRYRLNGAICITNTERLKETKSFMPSPAFAYKMPPEKSVDIDTGIDFALSRCLLEQKHGNAGVSQTD